MTMLTAAYLTQPHGLKGHMRAKILLEDAALLLNRPLPTSREGLTLTVTALKQQPGGMALVTVQGVTHRNGAEDLKGLTLFLPAEELPPVAENEVYLHSLIGRSVCNPAGGILGTVTGHSATAVHDYLEVTPAGGKTWLLPVHEEFIENLKQSPLKLTDLGAQLATLDDTP